MKRLLWLFTGIAVIGLFMLSCAPKTQPAVPTYTDPTQTITVSKNGQFVIQLAYDPASGYTWYEDYDSNRLHLLESTCVLCRVGATEFIGRQGFNIYGGQAPLAVQYARFAALEAGETRVTMSYKTSATSEAVEQLTFTVSVQP